MCVALINGVHVPVSIIEIDMVGVKGGRFTMIDGDLGAIVKAPSS